VLQLKERLPPLPSLTNIAAARPFALSVFGRAAPAAAREALPQPVDSSAKLLYCFTP
jgi:hypothetical protein